MKQSAFEVVGGNSVGEKAALMMEHETLIHEVGLNIPQTTVFASEMVQPVLDQLAADSNVGGDSLADLGEMGAAVAERFEGSEILAIRSSAEGDGRGNGIYESAFAANDRPAVSRAMAKVLRSFHEPHAADFRRQIEAGNNFAIMVQPLIGQWLEDDEERRLFGPPLSGYGYSKTRFDEEGVVNVVAGLGGGVDRYGGEQVTPAILKLASAHHIEEVYGPMTMFNYIRALRHAEIHTRVARVQTDFRDQRPLVAHEDLSSLRAMSLKKENSTWQLQSAYLDLDYYDYVEGQGSVKADSVIGAAVRAFDPNELLETLQRMQDIAGYPLYVEWATKFEDEVLNTHIVQIAPVDASPRAKLEAKLPKEILAVGNNLIGHGERQSKKLVICYNPQDVDALRDYNRDSNNEGYILIYSGHITSGDRRGVGLRFADFSNASVIIETNSAVHDRLRPLDHIGGANDMTGKIFATADRELSNCLESLYSAMDEDGAIIHDNRPDSFGMLWVLEGDFNVIADETQDRIFIGR